jgi:hypothetical protein
MVFNKELTVQQFVQQTNFEQVVYMAKHDPAGLAGFLLIGGAGVLLAHIQFMMVRTGYKTSAAYLVKPWGANGRGTASEYLKVRARHDWSPWPAYLLGPCVILGVALLVLGLFRL